MTISSTAKTNFTPVAVSAATTGALGSVNPPAIADYYGAPPFKTGANVKIGIISFGGGFKQSDANLSLAALGITNPPIINWSNIGIPSDTSFDSNISNSHTNNGTVENTLDIYCVAAIVPNANIVLYSAPTSSDDGLIRTMTQAVNDGCDILSISWDFIENSQFVGDEAKLEEFSNTNRVTIVAASGDYGSEDRKQDGEELTNWPASSEYVTAVGGTILTLNSDGTVKSESADPQSGGGISTIFSLPSWQSNLSYVTYPDNVTHTLSNRGVPDISAPFVGYEFYFNGNVISGFSGTSFSTPVMAGIFARYVSHFGRQGLVSEKFYNNKSLVNKITSGTNDDYNPAIGGYEVTNSLWDPVTGLGTLNGQAFTDFLTPTPVLTFPISLETIPVSGSFINTANTTIPGQIFYTSSNVNVATVDLLSGQITAVGIGTTTITATQPAVTYINKTASTSYTVNVGALSGSAKYNLGTTQIQDTNGDWQYLKGAWINNVDGTWHPVKTGWVCKSDGTWERIYPTPAGVFSADQTTFTFANVYQNHFSNVGTITVTNTGDYDLVINSVVVNDSVGNYTTTSFTSQSLPITIAPSASTTFDMTVFGNVVGTYSGNLQFTNYTGYLGYSNVTVPVTTTVIPDYNGIQVISADPMNFTLYVGEDTNTYSQSSAGSYTYTVPNGVSFVSVTIGGAGGGGGATDSHGGYRGFGGWEVYGTLAVTAGDTIEVNVGGEGLAGASGSHNYEPAGGYSADGFGGGAGGPSGYAGWSGSGGSGGGATTLYHNGTLIAVAGGGGGGGGGGNNSYGQGQQAFASSGSTAGGNGGDRGGSDGGGPGGGGGGYPGGAAGDIVGGDNGSYSGRNGQCLVPSGFAQGGQLSNWGAPQTSGGPGYMTLVEYGLATYATQTLVVQNSGNGANLNISNVASYGGTLTFSNISPAQIGYNFSTFTGNTGSTAVTPYTLPLSLSQIDNINEGYAVTYTDTILITSDALNTPLYSLPINITVTTPSGNTGFTTPGVHTWTVPDHVHSINMLLVGAGGGGGAALYGQGGSGGGGGSGGYSYYYNQAVTPGQQLTINVGAGGLGGADADTFAVYPVSLDYSWSSFMNTYAVWINPDKVDPVGTWWSFSRQWPAFESGTYTVEISADNHAIVYINGVQVGTSNSYTTASVFSFSVTQSVNTILIEALNDGGPAGVAAVIYDPLGRIVWTSRTQTNPGNGGTGGGTSLSGISGSTFAVNGGSGGAGGAAHTGGAGGAGGTPYGNSGAAGAAQSDTEFLNGGNPGSNYVTINFGGVERNFFIFDFIQGGTTYGTFGTGGSGADTRENTGFNGQDGGAVIWWGRGY